uniref:Uncharacterized protein n=1 Tax=Alexandrium catenella TaxID=2925 RepID=A0A7S1RU91_ALECA|mmetsp:Transcript_73621/g.195706  ORF Transcript_73621/g.195706 Transcript_73621/m.195706 type:complete len:234 (+) Transcript_73621:113-814(+)
MAGGFISTPYPAMDEHQDQLFMHRKAIMELKEKNAMMNDKMRQLSKSFGQHNEDIFWTQKSLVDLEDRKKYLRTVSTPNPSSIGQYSPNLKGPPAHEFYQQQVEKVKYRSFSTLTAEAVKFGGIEGGASPPKVKASPARRVPSNFSPFCGDTRSSLLKRPDHVVMGLRSITHTSAGKKPGDLPRLLPREPGTSEDNRFREHTATWMARSGTFDRSRSRAFISSLSSSLSSPAL